MAAGDRLDLIAQAAAGDSTRWWLLADANRWWDATELERPAARSTYPMPDTRVLIELDGQPLADEDFGRLADVQVEEATDQADAARWWPPSRRAPTANGPASSIRSPHRVSV